MTEPTEGHERLPASVERAKTGGGPSIAAWPGVPHAARAAQRLVAHLRRLTIADAAALVCLLFLCGAALANARLFMTQQVDDAYITFRYARNLAQGLGPVFNPGEHVEGTSTFLFMVLEAGAIRLGADALEAARFFGCVSLVLLVVVAYATVVSLPGARRGRRLAGLVAAAIVAASTPLAYFIGCGLETTTYAMLVAVTVCLLVRQPVGSDRVGWAVAAGFAATARPEGVFFGLMLIVVATAREALAGRTRGAVFRYAGRATLAFACVFGPLLAFRLGYYHAWVPNTAIAKSGTPRFRGKSLAQVYALMTSGNGFDSVKSYVTHLGLGIVPIFGGLAFRRTRFATSVALAVALGCATMSMWSYGDWMGFERLLTPAMTPVAVAVALGLSSLLLERESPSRIDAAASALVALGIAATVIDGSYYLRSERKLDPVGLRQLVQPATLLNDVAREDDVVATDLAGFFPYFSNVRTIDTFGLCDAYIARHGEPWERMGKIDFDYVIGRRPTFYFFNFASQLNQLYDRPSFASQRNDYLAVLSREYLASGGKLLAVRRDRPELARLAKKMDAKLVDLRDELHRLGLR
jgi:arabinofuranosyltransferase